MGLGEIGRIVESIRDEQREFRTETRNRFSQLDGTYVRVDLYAAESRGRDIYQTGLDKRISDLESANQWLVRLVIGLVLTALISGLFAATRVVGT